MRAAMPATETEVITPHWPAPLGVHACVTTRNGGVSVGPFASLNLATHVGDAPQSVAENRARLIARLRLPAAPSWLAQHHGTTTVEAEEWRVPPAADACFATRPGVVCAILTADCLPILACATDGSRILAIHAGWRGLLAGIVPGALRSAGPEHTEWLAWIGPGISVASYEVRADFVAAFCRKSPRFAGCFTQVGTRVFADLAALADLELRAAGVHDITRYQGCTAGEPARFFSHRRDGVTGRFASLIWLT